jgi:AcrR family transcriptional regulator
MTLDPTIVTAAIAEAEASGVPIAEVSLDRIARRAGVSRSTIFRRIRSRRALEEAVRASGVEPGRRENVRDRAVAEATALIVEQGVGSLTVEEVARRVPCATTSVHTRFGGREGLLTAVFERHAPLPAVEQALVGDGPYPTLEAGVRVVYSTVFDTLETGGGVMEALVAEALARPSGVVMQLAHEWVVPRIVATVGAWLRAEIDAGRCDDLPLSLLLPQLIAPISVHLIARKRLAALGLDVPDRDAVVDAMTAAFCRAVGTGS